MRLALLLIVAVSSPLALLAKSQEPNFHLWNHSNRDVHFIVCGANDLLTIKDMQLRSPTILTLSPGEKYEEHISLRGSLEDKPSLLYLYAKPQGEQQTFAMHIDIERENIHQTVHSPIADERVYGLGRGKKIYIEIVPGHEEERLGPSKTSYYRGLTVRSIGGESGEMRLAGGEVIEHCARDRDIGREWDYEKFGRWAQDNTDEFVDFLTKIETFLLAYLRAGNIAVYVWRYGIKGARDIARVLSAKKRMERKAGVKL